MSRDFDFNRAFVNLRRRIRKSQSEFAEILGCSRDAVISIENFRNGVSKRMRERVRQFGVILQKQGRFREIRPSDLSRGEQAERFLRIIFRKLPQGLSAIDPDLAEVEKFIQQDFLLDA